MDNKTITENIESLMAANGSTREEALEYILGRIVSHAAHAKDIGLETIAIDTVERLVMGRKA